MEPPPHPAHEKRGLVVMRGLLARSKDRKTFHLFMVYDPYKFGV